MKATGVPAPNRLPLWGWLLALPLVAVLLLLGLWVFAGLIAPGYDSSIVLGAVWFVLAYLGIRTLVRRRPALKLPVQGTFAVTAIAVAAIFALTTFRDKTVVEDVPTGVAASQRESGGGAPAGANVELARGEFVGLAHGASGTAAVVRLADGSSTLTFTDLDTDNGPDLRVYLVAGTVNDDGDVKDYVDLGRLKGNKGTQQYAIRDTIDTEKYATVVIWCRAFTVSFAKAELAPA